MFTLLDPDGIILFRHPDGADAAGKALSNKAIWLDAVAKGDAGFRVFGQADGNIRYVSIRKVPEYPLIVDISVTEATTLAIWRQRAAAIGLGSAIFLLLSVYLLRAMSRQVRLLSNSEASLAQKSQQLDAALNNMSQGVSMFDGRQRLIISNTQLAKIYRLTSEQTKPGTSFRAILKHGQPWAACRGTCRTSSPTASTRCPGWGCPTRSTNCATGAPLPSAFRRWTAAAGFRFTRTSRRKNASKPSSSVWRATML